MANKKQTKPMIFKVLIIVLPIALVLIISGVLLLTRDKNKEKNPETTPTPTQGKPVEEKTVDITLDNEELLLLPTIVGSFTTKNNYGMADEFYKEDVVDVLTLSIQKQLTIALVGMPSSKIQVGASSEKVILESDLQESFKNTFGNRVKYEAKDFSNFKYDATTKKYISSDGVNGNTCGGSISKTILAKKTTGGMEKLEVIEVVGFLSCENEKNTVSLYKDYGKKEMVADQVDISNTDTLLEQYKDKLSNYRYTFIKDDSGKYVFIKTDRM